MQRQIKDEQLQLLFAGLPSSLLATLLLLTLMATTSSRGGAVNVFTACIGLLLITALRFALWLAYRRQPRRENIAWSELFLAGCIAAGAAWGAAAVMVFPSGDVAA